MLKPSKRYYYQSMQSLDPVPIQIARAIIEAKQSEYWVKKAPNVFEEKLKNFEKLVRKELAYTEKFKEPGYRELFINNLIKYVQKQVSTNSPIYQVNHVLLARLTKILVALNKTEPGNAKTLVQKINREPINIKGLPKKSDLGTLQTSTTKTQIQEQITGKRKKFFKTSKIDMIYTIVIIIIFAVYYLDILFRMTFKIRIADFLISYINSIFS